MLRDYRKADASEINRIALAAFEEFGSSYSDWPAVASILGRMSELADHAQIVVAEMADSIIGAVAYIPAHRSKASYFETAWPIIRSLVVGPAHRGAGVGRALAEECIFRARRDASSVIALHSSPILTVALPMYLRMGFKLHHAAPPIYGVPYAVYVKTLLP